MLCFDVKLRPDARKFAEMNKIRVVEKKIIYHLYDEFNKISNEVLLKRKKEEGGDAVFPCVLK